MQVLDELLSCHEGMVQQMDYTLLAYRDIGLQSLITPEQREALFADYERLLDAFHGKDALMDSVAQRSDSGHEVELNEFLADAMVTGELAAVGEAFADWVRAGVRVTCQDVIGCLSVRVPVPCAL